MIQVASDIADAFEQGKWHVQPFVKQWASTFNTANAWWDATMSGISPRASYYSGDDGVFTEYPSGNHLSIFHGGDVAPAQKILSQITLHGSAAGLAPSRYILCDYLGFYTGISWETNEVQELDNTVTLPRYEDGNGVRAIIVQLFGSNANAVYTINYTNQSGVDKTSPAQTANALGTGALQHGQTSAVYKPYIDLAEGDSGIRKVNSITVTGLGAGVAVLILVKPLAEIIYRDATLFAPVEINYLSDKYKTPVIYDGAKLNFLFTSAGSPTNLLTRGTCEFIWS